MNSTHTFHGTHGCSELERPLWDAARGLLPATLSRQVELDLYIMSKKLIAQPLRPIFHIRTAKKW